MIYMYINTHDYENDVRVMTQAFYPGEKIITDEACEKECLLGIRVTVNKEFCDETVSVSVSSENTIKEVQWKTEGADKKRTRNRLKRELYGIFSGLTGKKLPWGTLTGIRPVKIPMKMIEDGYKDGEIIEELKNEYLVSNKKANLSLSVAHKEHQILSGTDYENGYSLYVGIPFCPTTCLYCSFTSYSLGIWKDRVDDYLEALFKELDFLSELLSHRKPDAVYIGGGTPTTLLPHQLDRLFTHIENRFDLSGILEYTVEAGRPDSIDKDKLTVIKDHGIDRISINPQTMNQETLDLIGRRHTTGQIKDAFTLARELGFGNINMDIIIGLPGEGKEHVKHTLEEIGTLNPDSLTVHSLALKRAAALNIFKDKYSSFKMENTDSIIDMTHDFAISHNMEPYYLYRQKNMAGNFENVGYAKPGKAGVYNILIMEEKQSIFAAGANAQSKIVFNKENRVERIENVKDVSSYIDRVDEMIERKRKFFDYR